MLREDGPQDESGWRPGSLDRLRALARRALIATLGHRAEGRAHSSYHRLLRRLGRFGPPEDDATRALLAAVAGRSRTIIDVGANVGRYAWFLRTHAAPGATLIALEPHPGAARLLRSALGAHERSKVLEIAAADIDGHGSLRVPRGAFGAPVAGLGWVQTRMAAGEDEIQIDLRRIDGLIDDRSIEVAAPVFMKIDVEGSEAHVLRGAAGLLRHFRPIIYFECEASLLRRNGESPDSLWRQLTEAGYGIFGSDGAGGLARLGRADLATVNYLGIPDPDGEVPGSLDAAATSAILDAWVVRVSGFPPSAVTAT